MNFILEVESILTMDLNYTVYTPGYIEIADGKIKKLSNSRSDFPENAIIKSMKTKVLTPGFFNTHSHAPMSLLRGIGDDLPLKNGIFDRIFPLERKWGDREFVYFGSLVSAVEMLKSGTIALNDMYYHELEVARAVHAVGLRGICGQTLVGISGIEDVQKTFDEFDGFIEGVSKFPRLKPAIAPHSIYGFSMPHWKMAIEYAGKKQLIVHTHLAETQEEMDNCQKEFGKTPTQVFEELGVWKMNTIAAHSTCITSEDIEILGRNKVGVAYNPESNLKLGTKICPVVELREKGANVGFGTDGAASNNDLDLLDEADFGTKLQVLRYGVGRLKARDAMTMLTREGAAVMGFKESGTIEVGKAADFILLEGRALHLQPYYDFYSRWIYAGRGSDVTDVMVEGEWLMQDRHVKTVDEELLYGEIDKWRKKIG